MTIGQSDLAWRRRVSEQRRLCGCFGAGYMEAPYSLRLGIAENVRTGLGPVNGLRHPPVRETSGWYIWAGQEMSDATDFFKPLQIAHVQQ